MWLNFLWIKALFISTNLLYRLVQYSLRINPLKVYMKLFHKHNFSMKNIANSAILISQISVITSIIRIIYQTLMEFPETIWPNRVHNSNTKVNSTLNWYKHIICIFKTNKIWTLAQITWDLVKFLVKVSLICITSISWINFLHLFSNYQPCLVLLRVT